jgi:hypothetical protein
MSKEKNAQKNDWSGDAPSNRKSGKPKTQAVIRLKIEKDNSPPNMINHGASIVKLEYGTL